MRVIVPVEQWNRVTERGLRFAMKMSPEITAIHVTEQETNEELIEHWRTRIEVPAREAGLPVPELRIIQSPYRQLYEPILQFVRETRKANPDRLIAVVVAELVRPRWWEYLLHSQRAGGLKSRLLLEGENGVVVINVPWVLTEDAQETAVTQEEV